MVMGYLSYIRDIEPEYHKKIQIYIEGLKTEQRLKRLGFGKRHGS